MVQISLMITHLNSQVKMESTVCHVVLAVFPPERTTAAEFSIIINAIITAITLIISTAIDECY